MLYNIRMQNSVSFTVQNEKIQGTLIQPENISKKLPAVLFIHGWTSSEKGYIPRAIAVSRLGFVCLTFSMRGHGESEGNLEHLSRQDHLEDCIAAYDYLTSQANVDKNKIHVVGASYGGYMASLLTAQHDSASLVLRAPALYPDDQFTTPTLHLIRKNIQIYRQKNLSHQENKALAALHAYPNNVLLIESENDQDVPKPTTNNFAQAIRDPRKLTRIMIPGADHALTQPQWNQFFINTLVSWFMVYL